MHFKSTLAMDSFDESAEWRDVGTWSQEATQEEDRTDMKVFSDMSEMDGPAGGKLYKMF